MCTVHCTLYNVHCKVFSLQCTLCSVLYTEKNCTVYTINWTMYTEHSILHSVQSTLYTIDVQCTPYTVHRGDMVSGSTSQDVQIELEENQLSNRNSFYQLS